MQDEFNKKTTENRDRHEESAAVIDLPPREYFDDVRGVTAQDPDAPREGYHTFNTKPRFTDRQLTFMTIAGIAGLWCLVAAGVMHSRAQHLEAYEEKYPEGRYVGDGDWFKENMPVAPPDALPKGVE